MRFLGVERATLDEYLPGLDKQLANHDLGELETPGSDALPAFRLAGGPGLLVPIEHGGKGATARQALRCTRAIGARTPSLALAATMHNFSVASLVALSRHSDGFEWMLTDAVARDRLLVSSAFAEGLSGQGVLAPTMRAVRDPDGRWRINGRKKPCTLSRSADIITASVALCEPGVEPELGVALITARSPGISVRPFWKAPVLTGAESDELVLEDVLIEDQLVVRPDREPGSGLDDLQTVGFIWFNLLVSGAYLGAASGLVERLLATDRGPAHHRVQVVTELEAAMMAVEHTAAAVDEGNTGNTVLANALVARYAAQAAIQRATAQAVELLGGMCFSSDPDVSYLASACHALAFHPPSRASMGQQLDAYFAGLDLLVT